jgi:hypothetical protein
MEQHNTQRKIPTESATCPAHLIRRVVIVLIMFSILLNLLFTLNNNNNNNNNNNTDKPAWPEAFSGVLLVV